MRWLPLVVLVACSSSTPSAATDEPDASTPPDEASPSAEAGVTPAPGPPRVSYIGRIDTSDPAGPRVGWSGTRVVVRFSGTGLTVKLGESETQDGGSRYDVLVDGKPGDVLAPTEGTSDYPVAAALTAGTHVVELVRRTEPQVGISQFFDFTFPGGGSLLAPPEEAIRRIEFVGDSESAGYGNECASADEEYTSATENEQKAYPSLVARSLNADAHVVAYSGKGVLRNGDDDPTVFETLYTQALPRQAPTPWSFATWKPDLVWLALGANDYSPGANGDREAPDTEAFAGAYRTLLGLVRAKNPSAQIVCVVETTVGDEFPADYQARTTLRTTLKSIIAASGDAKISFFELPQGTESELSGCDGHPSAALHAKLAKLVAEKVAAVTGWK